MISFLHYSKIKDKYCIAYFGNANEYLVQLKLLRPILEQKFSGTKIYLACKPESMYLLEGEERILDKDTLSLKYRSFAHVRELTCNMKTHPIENFLKESEIKNYVICEKSECNSEKTVIFPKGCLPTKSINPAEYNAQIEGNFMDAGHVIGVENEQLFLAASMGIKTTLINTGKGVNLFSKMFPNALIKN